MEGLAAATSNVELRVSSPRSSEAPRFCPPPFTLPRLFAPVCSASDPWLLLGSSTEEDLADWSAVLSRRAVESVLFSHSRALQRQLAPHAEPLFLQAQRRVPQLELQPHLVPAARFVYVIPTAGDRNSELKFVYFSRNKMLRPFKTSKMNKIRKKTLRPNLKLNTHFNTFKILKLGIFNTCVFRCACLGSKGRLLKVQMAE